MVTERAALLLASLDGWDACSQRSDLSSRRDGCRFLQKGWQAASSQEWGDRLKEAQTCVGAEAQWRLGAVH